MRPLSTILFLASLLAFVGLLGAATKQHRTWSPKRVESNTSCFLAEYARWRKLEQVVIFVNSVRRGIIDLVRSMNKRGVFVGLQSLTDPQLPSAINIPRHRLGAVILLGPHVSSVDEEFLEEVSQKQLFHAYVSWLILTEKDGMVMDLNSTIEERLKYLNIGPDTDLVVATLVNRTEERLSQDQTQHKHEQNDLNFPELSSNKNSNIHLEKSMSLRKVTSYGRGHFSINRHENISISTSNNYGRGKTATKRRENDNIFNNTQSNRRRINSKGDNSSRPNTNFNIKNKNNNNNNNNKNENNNDNNNNNNNNNNNHNNYRPFSNRRENKTKILNTNFNRRRPINEIGNCRENTDRKEYSGLEFSMMQVYKIRPTSNSTLITIKLGSWNPIIGTEKLGLPTGIEQHNDFHGHPLVVGIKNITLITGEGSGGAVKDLSSQSTDDDMEDDGHLMDLLDFIARSLNATYELVSFTKLGWQNEEKAWLFMLGAVTSGTIDLGLDNVVITQERSRDMFFTLPIVQSMKNIYFRRPESSAMRDIFLAPFSPRLLASVAATGVVIATAMVLVNASTAKHERKKETSSNNTVLPKAKWSLGEAMVWSVSVLCMQGSSWSPKSLSGCLVLIFSLCFALVIYNAYAAFITSVLSVRVASIRGLEDLLESDFQFGYTLRGQDEAFLRTVNDTALRRLYFRGLVRNHGVAEGSAGLLKASSGGYAFFVSARLARKALSQLIAQDKRCAIQELTVEATKSAIALPMGISSPYRKLINLSLLRMREAGVLGPIQERMLPPMPRCKAYSAFNSASLSDVYSAFLVLGAGLVTAVFMGLSEKVWNRRTSLVHWIVVKWASKDKSKPIAENPKQPIHRHMPKKSKNLSELQWLD